MRRNPGNMTPVLRINIDYENRRMLLLVGL